MLSILYVLCRPPCSCNCCNFYDWWLLALLQFEVTLLFVNEQTNKQLRSKYEFFLFLPFFVSVVWFFLFFPFFLPSIDRSSSILPFLLFSHIYFALIALFCWFELWSLSTNQPHHFSLSFLSLFFWWACAMGPFFVFAPPFSVGIDLYICSSCMRTCTHSTTY